MPRPLQRTSRSGLKSWEIGEARPSLVRQLIHDADPDIQEEWKWRGTPIWSHDGIVCTGESYKQVVKLTFAREASIKDPKKLFNSSMEGNKATEPYRRVNRHTVLRHSMRSAI